MKRINIKNDPEAEGWVKRLADPETVEKLRKMYEKMDLDLSRKPRHRHCCCWHFCEPIC